MSVRSVLRMGDPRLLARAQRVSTIPSAELDAVVCDLQDTMVAMNGAGLAAPQIGIPWRVVVFGVRANPRYPRVTDVPSTILINPAIEPLTEEQDEDWEGCLSVPGMRGLVPRYRRIRYRGVTPAGMPIERDVDGFHARVVQHECDHLDGILYPMRIRDLRCFGFETVLFPDGVGAPD